MVLGNRLVDQLHLVEQRALVAKIDLARRTERNVIGLALADQRLLRLLRIKREDINVEIEGARVSISAKTNVQSEKKEGDKVLYSERTSESYARAFELPQAVDAAAVVAKFENGVLTLTLPKKDAPKTKRIEIQ